MRQDSTAAVFRWAKISKLEKWTQLKIWILFDQILGLKIINPFQMGHLSSFNPLKPTRKSPLLIFNSRKLREILSSKIFY